MEDRERIKTVDMEGALVYWVTINLKTELIEDIIYDAGLAGNG